MYGFLNQYKIIYFFFLDWRLVVLKIMQGHSLDTPAVNTLNLMNFFKFIINSSMKIA